jgi:hypothetical protein
MTTTAFRIVLILEAIGMKRLMSHNATPTTTNTTTMFINGIFSLLSYSETIRGQAPAWRRIRDATDGLANR